MNRLIQDLSFACRILAKNKGFTAAAIITLALGIGANTALFSLVNGVLFSPLPFKEPDRIVNMQSRMETQDSNSNVSGANYLDWRDRSHTLQNLSAVNINQEFNLTGHGDPVALKGWKISPSFFDIFGMPPLHGRLFRPDEDKPGVNSVVLGNGAWKRLFGSDSNVVGKKIILDGNPYEVVGVMPKNLSFIDELVDVYVPLPSAQLINNRGSHYLWVFGRLAPGVTLDQARSELSGIARQIELENPDYKGWGVRISPLHEDVVAEVRYALLILYGVAGFVLLIVCVNVANLLLARSSTRSKEIAVRVALGASRGRIIRQLLTESVLLSLVGGGLGIIWSNWGIELLKAICPKTSDGTSFPMLAEITIDGRVLAFTLLISVLTGLAFGLGPALEASRPDLNESLKDGDRSTTAGRQRHRFLSAFSIAEVALSLVLLAGAGLMVKSYYGIQKINPGFDPKNVLCVTVNLPFKYGNDEQRVSFFEQVKERIKALPGVESVGINNLPPMTGNNCNNAFTIEGRPPLGPGEWIAAEYRVVDEHYFQTMRVPLKQGRFFTEHDDSHSAPVVIINESMAKKYFATENPVGQHLRIGGPPREIIGVVGDEKFWGLTAQTACEICVPYRQGCWQRMSLLIRTQVSPKSIAKSVERAIWSVDKDQPASRVTTMEALIGNSMSIQRFVLTMLCIFGSVALILAAVGVYGVMAYTASQRTHEIGVRIAMGAGERNIQLLLLKQGLKRVVIGLAIGLPIAIGINRTLRSLLHEVGSADPATLILVCLALVIVALAACFLPARKASRVEPTVALRCE